MKDHLIVVTCVAGLLMSACSTPRGSNEQGGMFIGGAGGALAGGLIGAAAGNTTGAVIGAGIGALAGGFAGGFAGKTIGKDMDQQKQVKPQGY